MIETKRKTVAQQRKYSVVDGASAKTICSMWLDEQKLSMVINFGLPEVDDRYHIWRVPLLYVHTGQTLGEIVIDAHTSLIIESKTTSPQVIEARILGRDSNGVEKKRQNKKSLAVSAPSDLRNTIAFGDSEEILQELPSESVGLIFTSPPYYNARPEYADYITYEEYLLKLRKIIIQAHRVLSEGRFFVMNIAPVLVRRANRNEASRRIAVPFDVHRLFVEEGYDFIDDIIWEKPEGAGWATGRGRRFAADRNPLQYKSVPVTEYILVYRKHSEKLIDWNIRNHYDKEAVQNSKISGDYEKTNIWRIKPSHDKRHPAIFPVELAEKVISYYSFSGDVVLDPFAGLGTVGKACVKMNRKFVLIERDEKYMRYLRAEAKEWLGKDASKILTINSSPINTDDILI